MTHTESDHVSRRLFLKRSAGCAAATVFSSPASFPALGARDDKPTIILIMIDDFGYEGIAANGGTTYSTPQINDMVRNGVNFSNCYATPTCTPSRVEIMSGQYCRHHGMFGGLWNYPEDDQKIDWNTVPSFGRLLQRAGYKTAVAGKWQLCRFDLDPDNAVHAGFDEHCLWTWAYNQPDGTQTGWTRYYKPDIWENGVYKTEYRSTRDSYGPDIFANFLIDFLKRNRDYPVFLYFPMALVHTPHHNPPGYTAADGSPLQNMVNYADSLVGRIREEVIRLGLSKHTLFLITGDNGFDAGVESDLNGVTITGEKHQFTHIGMHVPLVAFWEGTTPAGVTCNDPVSLPDFLPTIHELSRRSGHLDPGMKVDGRPFARQILEGSNPEFPDWCYQDKNWQKLVRYGDYTLYQNGKMYDVAQDLFEDHPIAEGSGTLQQEAAREHMQRIMDTIDSNYRELESKTAAVNRRDHVAVHPDAPRVEISALQITVHTAPGATVMMSDAEGRILVRGAASTSGLCRLPKPSCAPQTLFLRVRWNGRTVGMPLNPVLCKHRQHVVSPHRYTERRWHRQIRS